MTNRTKKIIVVICIQITIAAIHAFRMGTLFNGKMYELYYGYASDILMPFGFYFLLYLGGLSHPVLRNWKVRALVIFFAATATEVLQYFGIYALGVTFDPIDIVMFGIGVIAAVVLDTQIFPRLFRFWADEVDRV